MSNSALLYKYPLDLTGKSPTNLIINEPHSIGTDSMRVFATNSGPFFTEGVVVKDAITGTVLIPREQYLILQPYQEASMKSGLDVASIIYVTDLSVSTEILINYQAVGGEFSWSVYAIRDMIEQLDLDDRPVNWLDIVGTPSAFRPTPHLHDLGDTFGWEFVTRMLEDIRNAILTGDAASHDELRQQLTYLIDQVAATIAAVELKINIHEQDLTNPHQVSKLQVGLSNVDNYATANNTQALAGLATNLFLTPYGGYLLADKIAKLEIGTHTTNLSNPHQVTKAQVGLGNVDNYLTATKVQAEAGTSNTNFMTPLRTKEAIDVFVGNSLTSHISNLSNPHQVTKVQVGLGNVDNFSTATLAEAQAGTSTTRFMTPYLVAQAINVKVGNAFNAHLTNLNNPHNVTAAQINAYTIPQSDALLSQKLNINGTAVNSAKLEGSTYAQTLAAAYAQVGSMGKRALFISPANPDNSQGVVGDVWFKY